MGRFHLLVLALGLPAVSGLTAMSQSCAAEDLATRVMVQNELASICVDMCKQVGTYEKGCNCPNFVDNSAARDGVQTWKETLEYMSNLVGWGQETMKANKALSALQHKTRIMKALQSSKACMKEDMTERVAVQNKLHDICITMCKELGAFPEKCTCPGYKDTTDKTPGVMTWDELLSYMGDVAEASATAIKGWKSLR